MMIYFSTREYVCEQCSGGYHLRCCGDFLHAATWNVHSLVECVKNARICCAAKSALSHPDFLDDRKLNLHELQWYHVIIAGIQETKSDVWPAGDDWIFLHSGRPLPSSVEKALRTW